MTSDRFEIEQTRLGGLNIITRKPRGDHRGWFERLYCDEDLRAAGVSLPMRQINRSMTARRGTIRGLHFQKPPHAEMKLVSCIQGRVFDVAVDLRAGSPTYLMHHATELSADNARTFVIPEGFAHGFQTLSDDAVLIYLHTASYAPESEAGLHPRDAQLGIAWPEPVTALSDRDDELPTVADGFEGLTI